MDADVRTAAHGRQRLPLGENLGVGTNADLEVLRPHALCDQGVLDRARLRRAGTEVTQVAADDGHDRLPHRLGLARVAAGLLLDDALEQAGHERDAARLDRLQVARRQQPRQRGIVMLGR